MYKPPSEGSGSEAVDHEIEGGFNERFETGFRWYERAGRAVMLLYVMLALSGLLGSGPFDHRSKEAPDHVWRVDYEPILRDGVQTQITFHLPAAPPGRKAEIMLNSKFIEPMALWKTQPAPDGDATENHGVEMVFTQHSGRPDQLVRLFVRPGTVGLVQLQARLIPTGQPSSSGGTLMRPGVLSWTQLVLP